VALLSTILAMPTSPIFATPSRDSSTFLDLISRWTTLMECRNASPVRMHAAEP
jgi:hypothetical protein